MSAEFRAGVLPRRVRVSIIVAAYNSDQAALSRLMGSIDRQDMASRSVEVIFVDDGSTDDTRARLDAIAARRRTVVVRSIENSGWASRPRNVGIGLARGEYLLFMDHDDELLPGGLRAAYEFGRAHHADVVNAKEVRTRGWSWGWESFAADVGHVDARERNPLDPMTPHKLYRREFVERHGLKFPEGSRILWEDIYFNTLAFARGARVAILGSRAFYHWVAGSANTSSTFGHSADEFWTNLGQLLEFIDRELDGHPGRQPLLTHHVQRRVLGMLGPRSLRRPDAYVETGFAHARRLVSRFAPESIDAGLPAADRARLELVRHGDVVLQRLLAELDTGVTAVPRLDRADWDGATLVLTVSAILVDSKGDPLWLRRDGDRWLRPVPPRLAAALSDQALDVTADVADATFAVSVKGRRSRSTWALANGVVSCVPDGGEGGTLQASVIARFDPAAFAAEHGLSDPVWDFAARFEALGYTAHRGLSADREAGLTRVALLAGRTAVGYVNRDGLYSLDVSSAVRTVLGSARPAASGAAVRARRRGSQTRVSVRLPLPAVHCWGTTSLTGRADLGAGRRAPARLRSAGDRAELAFAATLPDGSHRLRAVFEGRTGDSKLILVVGDGKARLDAC